MSEKNPYSRIVRELRQPRPRVASRLTVSFVLACLLSAAALLGAWGYAMVVPQMIPTAATNPAVRTVTMMRWYHVRDEHVATVLVSAGFVWLLLLWRLWRPIERGRAAIGTILFTLAMFNVFMAAVALTEVEFVRRHYRDELIVGIPLLIASILAIGAWVRLVQLSRRQAGAALSEAIVTRACVSIGIAGGTVGLAVLVDRMVRMDDEVPVAAVICSGAAAFLATWLPVIFARETRSLRAETGHVDIRCPRCGYSLIGLRELRCPECGEQFVLDELIAAQSFAAT